jgi:hypothetical protein
MLFIFPVAFLVAFAMVERQLKRGRSKLPEVIKMPLLLIKRADFLKAAN